MRMKKPADWRGF
ncbi:hypothetical protein YPPY04_4743, partial [Yersinia pestis PY-04]